MHLSPSSNRMYFYQYPPPTKEIVDRIGVQMLNCPEFYFRVLEIMRSMNLPAPFLSDRSIAGTRRIVTNESVRKNGRGNARNDQEEEEEEEMDQDESQEPQCSDAPETNQLKNYDYRNHLKRILTSEKNNPSKSIKTGISQSSPFQRKISISLISNVNNVMIATTSTSATSGGFGTFDSTHIKGNSSTERPESPPFDFGTCLKLSAIRRGRMDKIDRGKNDLFKKYDAGTPSSRLYVKNISKKADKNDLRRLFGTFVDSVRSRDQFDVCLMIKGKLHGQAFVTFNNDEQAKKALYETNGYLLYDKPLVVMFARSKR